MKKVEEITREFDKEKWDIAAVHPMQSWEWGQAKKQLGNIVVRLGEFEDEELVNVFQMTIHKLPFVNKYIGYLPMGALVSPEVFQKLKDIANKNNIIFIKLEPYVNASSTNIILNNASHVNLKLSKSPHPLLFKWTMVLDLDKSEEELMAMMKQKTRYNVRLAEKKGVIAESLNNDKGFNTFIDLFFDTANRRGYLSHTPKYHKVIWDNMKDKISHILTVSYDNTYLGAFELFNFNGTLYYPYGGTSNEYRNLMSANLLMWESIKLGKKLGAKKYDMWGANPPDVNSKDYKASWEGLTKFKDGYGPEYLELIGAYDLVLSNFYYSIYNILEKLRSFYLSKMKANSNHE